MKKKEIVLITFTTFFIFVTLFVMYSNSGITGFFTLGPLSDITGGGSANYKFGHVLKTDGGDYSQANNGNFNLGRIDAGNDYRSFIDFDTSGISDTAVISVVALNISAAAVSDSIGTVSIYNLTQKSTSFTENSTLYAQCGGTGSNLITTTNSYSGMATDTYVIVDLGAAGVTAVQNNLANDFFSVGLKSSVEGDPATKLNTFDGTTRKPTLIINCTGSCYPLDEEAPAVTLLSPQTAFVVNSSPYNFSFNVTDNINVANCTFFTNLSSTWQAFGDNMSINTNKTEKMNFSITLPDGIYIWNIMCIDNSSNSASGSNLSVTFSSQYPRWRNNATFVNPTHNLTKTFYFNVTWNDTDLGNVIMENNFTGTLQNFSTSSLGNVYYYTKTGLSAGDYRWRMFANDSLSQINVTDTYTYVVGKAMPYLNLSFNSTEGNKTVFEMEMVSITNSSPEGVALTLYKNASSFTASVTNFSINYLNFTLVSTEDANYLSNNITYFLTVNRSFPLFTLIPNQSWVQDSSTTITLSNYASNQIGETLTFNSTTPSNIAVTFANGIATLTPNSGWTGTNYIIFNATDSTNDSANSTNITLTVEQRSAPPGGGGPPPVIPPVIPPVVPPPVKPPVIPPVVPPTVDPLVPPPEQFSPPPRGGGRHMNLSCNLSYWECERMMEEMLRKMNATLQKVNITKTMTYNNLTNTTLIGIEVTAKEDLENFEYYQDIPKCMAIYVNLVKFKNTNYEIVRDDPLIVWKFANVKQDQVLDLSFEVMGKIPDDCYTLLNELFFEDERFSPKNIFGMIGGLALLLLVALAITIPSKYSDKIKSIRKFREMHMDRRINKLKENVKKL